MSELSRLNEAQVSRVVEEVNRVNAYDDIQLEEVDVNEALEHDSFRRAIKGTEVRQGELSDEELEGYKKAGILKEEEGNLVINSVWLPGHIQKMEENGMASFDFQDELYKASNEGKGVEKLVYAGENKQIAESNHGGNLTFDFNGISDSLAIDGLSHRKHEEMIKDFLREATEIENVHKAYSQLQRGENHTISSKPNKTRKLDGGEIFMDTGQMARSTEALDYALGHLSEDVENLSRTASTLKEEELKGVLSKIDQYENEVERIETQVGEQNEEIQQYEAQIGAIKEAVADRIEGYAESANEIYSSLSDAEETLDQVRDTLGDYDLDLPDIEVRRADEEVQEMADELTRL